MRRLHHLHRMFGICLIAVSSLALGESKNPADYPLRIHIFRHYERDFYRFGYLYDARGVGRADLFEGSHVHGVDFNFDCSRGIVSSFGFETYPARWEKTGRRLVVLLPVFGKADSYYTCDFNTDVKGFAYFWDRHGLLDSEPSTSYESWMVRHDYDPVHGKNIPTRTAPQPAAVQKVPLTMQQ